MLKRLFSRAPKSGVVDRIFARRRTGCLVLGRGFTVSAPRCCACGKNLSVPHPGGETFLLAAPMLEPGEHPSADSAGTWLFFGANVLVATVSPRLAAMLDSSVAFFGERILVAMVRMGMGAREPRLLCKPCGADVLSKVNPPSQQYYAWDWLAELEPRGRELGFPPRNRLAKGLRCLSIAG